MPEPVVIPPIPAPVQFLVAGRPISHVGRPIFFQRALNTADRFRMAHQNQRQGNGPWIGFAIGIALLFGAGVYAWHHSGQLAAHDGALDGALNRSEQTTKLH